VLFGNNLYFNNLREG